MQGFFIIKLGKILGQKRRPKLREISLNFRTWALRIGEKALRSDPDELAGLDFSPIYRCLHISRLEQKPEEFAELFMAERNKQMSALVVPSTHLSDSDKIGPYIHQIVGFLFIEEEIQSSAK